jgi:hypothetical protein
MFIIKKKRKKVEINYLNYVIDIKINIGFTQNQLEKIIKCNTMYYNVLNYIIVNIPNNITNIQFCSKFNSGSIFPYLHKNIYRLSFGNNFNQDVSNLPQLLTNLQFGNNFNQDVSNLPIGLKILAFGNNFNNNVDYLPNSLEYLKFGFYFNQDISNLPNSIRFIGFGRKFNHSIENLSLNYDLEQICFSSSSEFNQNINNLPKNIKLLSLPFKYSEKINIKQEYYYIECIKLRINYLKENFLNFEYYNDKIMFSNIFNDNYITLKKKLKIIK